MTPWPVAPLRDLAATEKGAITDGPFGSNLTSAHYTTDGPQVVRLQNIGDGFYRYSPAHIAETHFESLRKHEVLPGDLLIASLGDDLPRSCLAPTDIGPAIVKADCIRVRLRGDVDPRWVMYALQRQSVRRWARERIHGVGRQRLGLKLIREIPIPLPELVEQRRVLEILEDHLSRLSNAHSNLLKSAGGLDLARRALTDSLFNKPWSQVSIGAVTNVVSGPAFRSREFLNEGEGTRLLRGENIAPGFLRWDRTRTWPARLMPGHEHLMLAEHDIILAMDRPLISGGLKLARVTQADIPSLLVQRVARIRVQEGVLADYLYLLLDSPRFAAHLKLGQVGTQLPHITLQQIREFSIPLPTLWAQRQIVAMLEEHLHAIHRARSAVDLTTLRQRNLSQALLSAAFSGQLSSRPSHLYPAENLACV